MVNYQNGKIYKIESMNGDLVYIGSTTKEYLSQRMDTHRMLYKRWKLGNTNKTTSFDVFDAYGVENCSIILLETCPCKSKDELYAREAYYIKSMKCVNRCVPRRSKEDLDAYQLAYTKEHTLQRAIYKKHYNETHKTFISEQQKKWRDANKDAVNASQRERRQLRKQQQTV